MGEERNGRSVNIERGIGGGPSEQQRAHAWFFGDEREKQWLANLT